MKEVTHMCPPDSGGLMPCCGRTLFEVPETDRITADWGLVTCPGAQIQSNLSYIRDRYGE